MNPWIRVTTAAGVLAGAIVFLQLMTSSDAVPLRRTFEEFPREIGAYRGVDEGLEPDVLKTLGATDVMMRHYTATARPPVWVYAGYYASQRTGTIIHSPKQCLPGNGWSILESARVVLDVPGSSLTVNRVLVANGESRQVVLYWYQERGRVVASEYWGKAYLAWDAMTRGRTDGALVRISAPVALSDDDADRQVAEFAREIFPMLTAFLPA